MLIEGPLRISVAEATDGQGWVLVLAFKPEFQALDLPAQGEQFKQYLQGLNGDIETVAADDDHNRAGMLIIQQIVEQLLPHVEAGDLDVAESIIIQIQQNSQVVALTDLLQQR